MQTSAQSRAEEFKAAVIDSFRFLENDYGFLRQSLRNDKYTELIIYENLKTYVALSYGPPAYEPELSFGRRGIDDAPGAYSFHPGDLVQLHCCREWTWSKSNGSALRSWVSDLARLLYTCGALCLANDFSVYNQMKSRRDELILEWRRNEDIERIRHQIESAWRGKHYGRVLELYEFINDLSEIDKKRVAFAKANDWSMKK